MGLQGELFKKCSDSQEAPGGIRGLPTLPCHPAVRLFYRANDGQPNKERWLTARSPGRREMSSDTWV